MSEAKQNKSALMFLELEQLENEISGFHLLISGYLQMISTEGLPYEHQNVEIFINTESRRIANQFSGIREKIRQTA